MGLSKFMSKVLSSEMKNKLRDAFPALFKSYTKRALFSELALKPYYNPQSGNFDFPVGSASVKYPLKFLTTSGIFASFNLEFCDFVSPFINGYNKRISFDEGPYEIDEVKLKSGDVILDCGANIGLFSFFAAAKTGGLSYAFEPLPANVEALERIARLNPDLNVRVVKSALGNEKGKIKFTATDYVDVGSKILDENSTEKSIKVDLTTIDDFVSEQNLSRVDFIKADIEGAERLMLAGAKNTLKTFKPRLALCTYHLPDDPQVMEQLITDINPEYKVIHKYKKLYAY